MDYWPTPTFPHTADLIQSAFGDPHVFSLVEDIVVVYTGHGRERDGALVLPYSDALEQLLTFDTFFKIATSLDTLMDRNLTLVLDSCHAGAWLSRLEERRDSATQEAQTGAFIRSWVAFQEPDKPWPGFFSVYEGKKYPLVCDMTFVLARKA